MVDVKKGGNIVISGVGGQGTLLASRIIGQAALAAGFDVKVSEVHGMSQRGGSVVTYVRYSADGICSPVIADGCADAVLAFELLEGYRSLPCLKKGGLMIVNEQRIDPSGVMSGAETYPGSIAEKLSLAGVKVVTADATALAIESGDARAANVVLIGIFAAYSGIAADVWIDTVKKTVPPKALDANLRAFETAMRR